jgi:hypothetical protein
MCAIEGSKGSHRYALGTYDIGSTNFMQVIEYVEDKNKFNLIGTYSHEGQVNTIESCPSNESLIATSSSDIHGKHIVNVWKIPPARINSSSDGSDSFNMDVQDLTLASALAPSESSPNNSSTSVVNSMRWNKKKDQIITLDSSTVSVYSVANDKAHVR